MNSKSTAVRNSLLAIAVGVVCAAPVAAQNTTAPNASTASTMSAARDDGRSWDWGWLGLLGLAGLLGMRRESRVNTDRSPATSAR